jgi:hypothetical protein
MFLAHEEDDEVTQKTKTWLYQFVDWAVKLLIVGIFWFCYNAVKKQDEMITQMALDRQSNSAHIESIKMTLDNRISLLEKETQFLKSNMVSMEVLKRVEQQLTIILLQSGIKNKVVLTDPK